MRASVVRAADKTQLYLVGCPDGSWRVANVIASGRSLDPGLRDLLGRVVSAERVLAWAGGTISTETLGRRRGEQPCAAQSAGESAARAAES